MSLGTSTSFHRHSYFNNYQEPMVQGQRTKEKQYDVPLSLLVNQIDY